MACGIGHVSDKLLSLDIPQDPISLGASAEHLKLLDLRPLPQVSEGTQRKLEPLH